MTAPKPARTGLLLLFSLLPLLTGSERCPSRDGRAREGRESEIPPNAYHWKDQKQFYEGWAIGFRYDGALHTFNKPMEFASVDYDIKPGAWEITARKSGHKIILKGAAGLETMLNLPNPTEEGMKNLTWESLTGDIRVQLYKKERRHWVQVTDTSSDMAGLEVGGEKWRTWDWPSEKLE